MKKHSRILKKHTRPPAERDHAYWINYYCGILAGPGVPTDFEREPDREIDPDPRARKTSPKKRRFKRSL